MPAQSRELAASSPWLFRYAACSACCVLSRRPTSVSRCSRPMKLLSSAGRLPGMAVVILLPNLVGGYRLLLTSAANDLLVARRGNLCHAVHTGGHRLPSRRLGHPQIGRAHV